MKTAQHKAAFPLSAENDGRDGHNRAAKVGKWTYTPLATGSTPDRSATLRSEGQEVDLRYSSSIFEDFLEAVHRIESEFNRRSQEAAPLRAPAGEYSGQMSRV